MYLRPRLAPSEPKCVTARGPDITSQRSMRKAKLPSASVGEIQISRTSSGSRPIQMARPSIAAGRSSS